MFLPIHHKFYSKQSFVSVILLKLSLKIHNLFHSLKFRAIITSNDVRVRGANSLDSENLKMVAAF